MPPTSTSQLASLPARWPMDPCAHGVLAYLSVSEVRKHLLLLLLRSFIRVPMVEMCMFLVTPVFVITPQIFPPPPGRPWESGGWGYAEPQKRHVQLHTIPSNTPPFVLFGVPLPPPPKTVSQLREMSSQGLCRSSLPSNICHTLSAH